MTNYSLKSYTKEQLDNWINSSHFKQLKNLPISSHRAISHIHNPRVNPNDILLAAFFEQEELIAYIGMIPDDCYSKGEPIHFAWLSCLWVASTHQGKGLSKQLINYANDQYQGRILLTEFTETAKQIYNKLSFLESLTTIVGMRYFVKLNSRELIPRKFPKLKFASPLLKACDNIGNQLISLLSFDKNHLGEIKDCDFHDPLVIEFIAQQSKLFSFRRGVPEVRWTKSFPWILTDNEQAKMECEKYYFSGCADQFENLFMSSYSDSKPTCVMYVIIRDGHLRVPYFFGKIISEEWGLWFRKIIKQYRVHTITVYQNELQQLFNREIRFLYRKKQFREYKIGKALNPFIEDCLEFQDGDGDCAFT